jgi:hypothetical protein
MKEPDPLGDFNKLLLRKKPEEIVTIPAALYFPAVIVAQLNEICDVSGYTPGQLVVKALKGQIYHWGQILPVRNHSAGKAGGSYLPRGPHLLPSVHHNYPFSR